VKGFRVLVAREIDLPVVIVWDALVDEILLSGWLAETTMDAHIGGAVTLDWHDGGAASVGTVTALDPLERIVIDTNNRGVIEFTVTELEGGTRGSGTRVDVTIEAGADPRFARSDLWSARLENLAGLVRGHPVDWNAVQIPDRPRVAGARGPAAH
jgi:uncharacterized protein YndB with AHSA1/START domain